MSDHEDGTARRWTRALGDLPLTERSAPRYGDLVNVDWPSEAEYKHHTSNWETYKRKDFHARVLTLELVTETIGKKPNLPSRLATGLVTLTAELRAMALLASGLLSAAQNLPPSFQWLSDLIQRFENLVSSTSHSIEVFLVPRLANFVNSINLYLGVDLDADQIWNLLPVILLFVVVLILPVFQVTQQQSKRSFELSNGSVEPVHLAFLPRLGGTSVEQFKLCRFVESIVLRVAAFVELIRLSLLANTLSSIILDLVIWVVKRIKDAVCQPTDKKEDAQGRSVPVGDLNRVRTVWVGNGQVQFGCGPKGISVEHHGGYIYLAHWDKIEDIYDSDVAFGYECFQVCHETKGEHDAVENACSLSKKKRKRDVEKKMEECRCDDPPDGFALDKRLSRAKGDLATASRAGGWAEKSIRIRLYESAKDDLPDEIVIPWRFFGEQRGQLRWEQFMALCLTYKHFRQDAEGAGKSAGSIEIGRPAHH